jgi:hypothetical protein
VANEECKIGDKTYCDLLFNIRQTMQIVQNQFEVMNDAVEKCSYISIENVESCIGIINTAHQEITRFQELNSRLVSLFNEFRKYVLERKL